MIFYCLMFVCCGFICFGLKDLNNVFIGFNNWCKISIGKNLRVEIFVFKFGDFCLSKESKI